MTFTSAHPIGHSSAHTLVSFLPQILPLASYPASHRELTVPEDPHQDRAHAHGFYEASLTTFHSSSQFTDLSLTRTCPALESVFKAYLDMLNIQQISINQQIVTECLEYTTNPWSWRKLKIMLYLLPLKFQDSLIKKSKYQKATKGLLHCSHTSETKTRSLGLTSGSQLQKQTKDTQLSIPSIYSHVLYIKSIFYLYAQ